MDISKNQKFANYKLVITLGVIMIVIGLILLTNNYFESKILKAYNDMNLKLLALNPKDEKEETNTTENNQTENKEEPEEPSNNKEEKEETKIPYVASIEIPKISLKHGLAAMDSKYNSVNYGIEIIKGSSYPNVVSGNLILASHSGTSYRSIFKNLYKLKIGDKCTVTYKNKTYKYVITNIYNQPKIGKVTIDRDYTKNTLTLITCTKNSDTQQTIYIAEFIK